MSLNVSTNTAALRAGAYLSSNNANLQKSLDRLASGKRLTSPWMIPVDYSIDEVISCGKPDRRCQSNVQNAISFLEVQDGMLETVGQILDRMSELKGFGQF